MCKGWIGYLSVGSPIPAAPRAPLESTWTDSLSAVHTVQTVALESALAFADSSSSLLVTRLSHQEGKELSSSLLLSCLCSQTCLKP